MQGPTPSQRTNELLDQIQESADNTGLRSEVSTKLEERIQNMPIMLEEMLERAHGQGEDFVSQAAPLIGLLEERIGDVIDTLEQALAAIKEERADDFDGAAQEIADATNDLFEVMNVYTGVFMTYGESPFGLVNAVKRIMDSLAKEELTKEQALTALDGAGAQIEVMVEEIEKAELSEKVGWDSKLAAAKETLARLAELRSSITENRAVDLAGSLSALTQTQEQIDRSSERVFEEEFLNGPTGLPGVNLLLKVVPGVQSGVFQVDSLVGALEWYELLAAEFEEEFEALLSFKSDSAALNDEIPKTRDIMDRHQEVLDEIFAVIESKEELENLTPLMEELKGIADELVASRQVYHDLAEMEGKLFCPFCGSENPADSNHCSKCNRQIPKMLQTDAAGSSTFAVAEEADEFGSESPVVTENMLRVFEACHKFHEGETEADEFLKVLDWLGALVARARRGIESQNFTELTEEQKKTMSAAEIDEFHENIDMIENLEELAQAGVVELEQGLEGLYEFCETRNLETAQDANVSLFEGFQKVYRVGQMGVVAKEKLTKQGVTVEPVEEPEPPKEEELPSAESDQGQEYPGDTYDGSHS